MITGQLNESQLQTDGRQQVQPNEIEDVKRLLELDNVELKVAIPGEAVAMPELSGMNIPEADQEIFVTAVEAFINYLKKDVIVDKFKNDHAARRAYRDEFKHKRHPELVKAFEQVFEKNKLRFRNGIGPVKLGLETLQMFEMIDYLPVDVQTHFSNLETLLQKFPTESSYDNPSVSDEDKHQFAKDLSNCLKNLLRALDSRQNR